MTIVITDIVIALVALLHVAFLVLEMFLWGKPLGMRVFRQTAERATITCVLAANQGLYNGFLAAALVWGLILGSKKVTRFKFSFSAVLSSPGFMVVPV